MARKPRIHLPGAVYHVVLRGNDRQKIFFCDGDRRQLYELLEEGTRRFGHRIHAFCCMTNHLHLVIQVADVSLSEIIHNISFRYTLRINRSRKRVGHLFAGRFRAILVDTDRYLLELVRYVHLNPVRAGLVVDPSEYSWSGHRAYLGMEKVSWLTTNWILSQFSEQIFLARRRYEHFVREDLHTGHQPRPDFHRGLADPRILGEDNFVEQALAKAGNKPRQPPRLGVIVDCICNEYGLTEADLRAPCRYRKPAEARAVIAWIAVKLGSSKLTEVARRFGRDLATVSLAVRRTANRIEKSKPLKQQMLERILALTPERVETRRMARIAN